MKSTQDEFLKLKVDTYVYIFSKLRKKYMYKYPDYLISKAAKTGCNWLFSVASWHKDYNLKIKIIEDLKNKAIEVSEKWLNEFVNSMFDKR